MNRELKEALEQWNDRPSVRNAWRAMTEDPVFKEALRLSRLLVCSKAESIQVGVHSQVADRELFIQQGAMKALTALESLGEEPPKPPKPLPAPFSCYAEPQHTPDP